MGASKVRWRAAFAVYFTALVAGLSVVSFAASATVLKAALHLTDSEYGAIFLPQVAFSILGSIAGGSLSSRVSPRSILQGALLAFAAAELALYGSSVAYPSFDYGLLLAATGCMGTGFGLAAAPLNTLPGRLFPGRAETALVALHTAVGAGFAVGPVLIAQVSARTGWRAAPIGLSIAAVVAIALVAISDLPGRARSSAGAAGTALPYRRLLPYFLIGVLYAFAEGTFANWSTVFLKEERGIDSGAAALALGCFWAGLAGGRLLVSAILVRVPWRSVWLALPVAMAASAALIPAANGAIAGILVFTLAGLSCSAFFPLTVSAAVRVDSRRADAIASAMTAALMLGVGLGSFTVGPLRETLSIAQIYRASAVYPCAAFVLALLAARGTAPEMSRAVVTEET